MRLKNTPAVPRCLMKERQYEYPGDGLLRLGDGAPAAGDGGVAHVHVPLDGQGQRQPDGGSVEDLKTHLIYFCQL